MDSIILQSVSKVFHHRPALFNWLGREQGGTTVALDQVSLRVPAGSILALLGPNGSGKTTLLKLISTTLLPDSGRVLVQGADTQVAPQRVRSCVGFAMANERSFFPRLTAQENLDFFAALEDVPRKCRKLRIETTLAHTGLQATTDTLVRKFSSGMYQRLAIARAVIKQPSVLLLDEPTRSLDSGTREDFWCLVRKLAESGTAIVMATHNFEEAAAVGDRVVVLHRGQLAGYRQLGRVAPADLRSFYSQSTGEAGEEYNSESLIESLQ